MIFNYGSFIIIPSCVTGILFFASTFSEHWIAGMVNNNTVHAGLWSSCNEDHNCERIEIFDHWLHVSTWGGLVAALGVQICHMFTALLLLLRVIEQKKHLAAITLLGWLTSFLAILGLICFTTLEKEQYRTNWSSVTYDWSYYVAWCGTGVSAFVSLLSLMTLISLEITQRKKKGFIQARYEIMD